MANEVSYDAGLMDFAALNDQIALARGGCIENHGVIKINTNVYKQSHNTDMQGSTDEGKNQKKQLVSEMYETLRSLLPQLPEKADQAKILDEATNFIISLEKTLKNLERKKLERLLGLSNGASITPLVPSMGNLGTNLIATPSVFKTLTSSSNVTVHVCGSDAHINICSLKKSGFISSVSLILVKNNLEPVSANISSDDANIMIMIHVRVNVPHELAGEVLYEEIYKQVTNEIMLIVNDGIKE